MRILHFIFAVLAAIALTACGMTPSSSPLGSPNGYQFGDLTHSALTLQARYCAEADPRERAVRLAVLRAAGVPVPPSGVCTDILALVPSHALGVDVEQAEEDRRRFEGVTDADSDTQAAQDDARTD